MDVGCVARYENMFADGLLRARSDADAAARKTERRVMNSERFLAEDLESFAHVGDGVHPDLRTLTRRARVQLRNHAAPAPATH